MEFSGTKINALVPVTTALVQSKPEKYGNSETWWGRKQRAEDCEFYLYTGGRCTNDNL